ncbi:MAG: glycosyltransferase family 4 protein [Gemmatales bacterium]|nr:glycosyltransferase family 4 protein [Gemmatales bacterium]MDW8385603.1 glycosyltransferase family 4 protein [Gemmatales bacterium]
MAWHLITGEYPPQCGGVGDYTAQLAQALVEAGETVTVWCPAGIGDQNSGRVRVRAELGRMGWSDFRRMDQLLDAEPRPRRLVVQWVPHAFGRRAVNWPFCRWVRSRARRGDELSVMIHEAFLDYSGSLKKRLAAFVQRLMMRELLAEANAAWVSTAAWLPLVRPYARPDLTVEWLPVPSNVQVFCDQETTMSLRQTLAPDGQPIVGHFGTYGGHTAELLRQSLFHLCKRRQDVTVLLLGRQGEVFRQRLVQEGIVEPRRIHAPGRLEAGPLSIHLAACDVMMQPYCGGISTRNGSLMACLSHGRPVVASRGSLTEPEWEAWQAVELTDEHDLEAMAEAICRLLNDPGRRQDLAQQAQAVYEAHFSLRHTVERLLAVPSAA